MRKIAAIAAAVAVLAVIGGGATLASGEDSSSQTIRLVERTTEFGVLDFGDPGPSVGDTFTFHGNLFDRDGNKVGRDGRSCTQTTAAGESNCTVTARLEGGHISAQGLIRSAEIPFVATFAVTGGTGQYRDVGGQIRVEQETEEEANLTVRLISLG
jgi:allene oxide cyclase-like protein